MRVLIIVLGLFGAVCAVPRQPRIVGGEATTIEKYPFTANMVRRTWSGVFSHSCGGTLITSTSVVSAGHCYPRVEASSLRVRLGSTYASSGGKDHIVSRIIMHEQYHPRLLLNDIAVIRLSDSAVFSNQIQAARIAGPRYALPDNTLINVLGWGTTEFNGWSSEVLQDVEIKVINQEICAERYEYLKTLPDMSGWPDVTPEMFCSGILDVGGKDACHGDSGGPVIHNKDILVGITSWGYECAHSYYPGVNVRVSSYTDWIYTKSLN